jgi:hypothetical protein
VYRGSRGIVLLILNLGEDGGEWTRWNSMEFHFINDSSQKQYWLTIPEAVSTVMCS